MRTLARSSVVAVAMGLAVGLAACRGDGRDRPPSRPDDGHPPPGKGDGRPARTWRGPPVEVDVVEMESYPVQWAAIVKLTAPTGGHRLTLDDVRHRDGRLQMRVTLEQPGRDELVTQALQTLTVRHGTGIEPIRRVEVLARMTRRGDAPRPGGYALAATR